jgi:hypothetical protein
MVVAHPAYTDPVNPLDWLAVWSFSLAFLLTAAAIVASPGSTPTRGSRAVALLVVVAATVAGIANALEDGFPVDAMFGVYAVSAMIALIGPFLVALAVAMARRSQLAGWWAALGLGFLTFPIGGGLIILAVALVPVARPRWLGSASAPLAA